VTRLEERALFELAEYLAIAALVLVRAWWTGAPCVK
jgi:hypothetical protein